MPTRTEIRQTFAAAIKDAITFIHVFDGRHIDHLHDVLPAAIVSFDSVAVDQDISGGYQFTGTIATLIISDKPEDSEVDLLVDVIIPAIQDRMQAQLPTVGCMLLEIAYNRELDPGVAAAALVWQVDYSG